MPGSSLTQNMVFSFNLGPIHFLAIDNTNSGCANCSQISESDRFDWVRQDLDYSNGDVRWARPWIIVILKSPVYTCQNPSTQDKFGRNLEELFYKYNVDLVISSLDQPLYERYRNESEIKLCLGSPQCIRTVPLDHSSHQAIWTQEHQSTSPKEQAATLWMVQTLFFDWSD